MNLLMTDLRSSLLVDSTDLNSKIKSVGDASEAAHLSSL